MGTKMCANLLNKHKEHENIFSARQNSMSILGRELCHYENII